MDVKTISLVLIIFVVFLLFEWYQRRKRNNAINSLMTYLNNKDYDSFEKACETKEVKAYIPDYNLNFLKLSAALMQNDNNKIESIIKEFDNIKMTDAQKKALYDRCFYYYVGTQNKNKAETYYQLLMSMDGVDKNLYSCFYDTYILKGSKYLDDLLNKVENLPINQKLGHYTLIADMYRNKNDDTNAAKYDELVKELLKKN